MPSGGPGAGQFAMGGMGGFSSLNETQKKNWKDALPKIAFAYNSTMNKATGFSPFFLMFGRESTLPIDAMFGLEVSDKVKRKSHREFVEEWKSSMEEAFKVANENSKKAGDYNKRHYDKGVKEVEIAEGDHVLVRNMREKGGTGKLRNHWESNIFKVVNKDANLPVYNVKNLHNGRDKRKLHRNMLLRVNELPVELFEANSSKVPTAGQKTVKDKSVVETQRTSNPENQISVEESGDDEAELLMDLVALDYRNRCPKAVGGEDNVQGI